MQVEVEDSGSPSLRAQHPLTVTVLDQNDSPSTPRTAHLLVYSLPSALGATLGLIADVRPNDPDATGDYRCKILSGASSRGVLSIPSACNLHASRIHPGNAYSLSVYGNDGVHPDVISTVTVEFQAVDNDTVDNSVTVRVDNMTAPAFLTNHYKAFVDVLKSALQPDDVVLAYSLLERDGGVEVAVAARGAKAYHSRSAVLQAMLHKQDALQKLVAGRALTLGYSPCQRSACDNGSVCSEVLRVLQQVHTIDSPGLILTAPAVRHEVQCRCADGFTGPRCDRRQDPCAPNPCRAGGTCRRQGADFQCLCPSHTEGRHCELERGDACHDNPCRNGGSCRQSPDGASFFCLCRPGFRGNQCEAVADSCRPNPCLFGGVCVSLKPGYRCTCPDGRYGRHCERSTYGFRELSYAAFPSLDASTNDISVVFATSKPDALLMYNFGAQTGGRSDFVALELVAGRAVFSFGGARTAISSLSVAAASLADGAWHKVTATRNGRVVSLSVAACTDNGDTCLECRPDDEACYAADVGITG